MSEEKCSKSAGKVQQFSAPERKRNYSPADAAKELLGWVGPRRGRDLMRLVFRAERKLGREIAIRVPSSKSVKGTRYQLTEAMLAAHLPQLFATKIDELRSNAQRKMDAIEGVLSEKFEQKIAETIEHLKHEGERMRAVLGATTRGDEQWRRRIEGRLSSLERAVENLGSQSAPKCPLKVASFGS